MLLLYLFGFFPNFSKKNILVSFRLISNKIIERLMSEYFAYMGGQYLIIYFKVSNYPKNKKKKKAKTKQQ